MKQSLGWTICACGRRAVAYVAADSDRALVCAEHLPTFLAAGWCAIASAESRLIEVAHTYCPPIAKKDGPKTSRRAARRFNPSRPSKRIKVLQHLMTYEGEWVPGFVVATQNVGGSEGLRRLRELRDAGFIIDEQPIPHSTAWMYRLRLDDVSLVAA